jgi:guanylate kinase
MSDEKYEVIALFGKSASGKDTIQKWIVSNFDFVHGIVSCTTRPIRENEQEGIDYYYLTNEQFAEKVLNGDMLEATSFNNWFYGTPIDALVKDKVNVGVFNIAGINCLLQDSRIVVKPIMIYADDKTRLLRSLTREDKPNCAEICRRFMTDEKDFDDFDFWHSCYFNEDGKEIDKDWWANYLTFGKPN